MAEAFIKTLKRDYLRVSPIGDAAAALTQIDRWMEDYTMDSLDGTHETPSAAKSV